MDLTIRSFAKVGESIPKDSWFSINEVFERTNKSINRMRIKRAIGVMVGWGWLRKTDQNFATAKRFHWNGTIQEVQETTGFGCYTEKINQSFSDIGERENDE